MSEPDMREPCEAFEKAQIIIPSLKKCPGGEIQVLRSPAGHGGRVCQACRKKNRNEQRKRENAQKRARRAKLKKEKMNSGIGNGNVVWTPPKAWTSSVVDAHTLALHSPQPQRLFKVRSTTQALQHALNGDISTARMTEKNVDVAQHEREIFSESCHATMSNAPQSQDHAVTEVHDKTDSQQCLIEPQSLPTTRLDEPLFQGQKHQPVGLGITIANDAKWDQCINESYSVNEWTFRMELNKWSTVFEDDDPDGYV